MPYTHLLAPSDGTDLSRRAVEQAATLAATLGARLTVLHAQESLPMPIVGMGDSLDSRTVEWLLQAARQESERILSEALASAAAAGITAGREQVQGSTPHQAILAAAERLGCDLIVMASHGRRGIGGLLLGSETQRVLLRAPCPVLVVR
jgi:nucleotide-binding universal stress UspA family protein